MSKSADDTLSLTLLNKEYRIACAPEAQEPLRAAAALLASKLQAIAGATKSSGERLAMMAALDLAHEIVTAGPALGDSVATNTNENLQRTIDSIEARINLALEQE
jgi:cell division protein ZapA